MRCAFSKRQELTREEKNYNISYMTVQEFQKFIMGWYAKHKRSQLPWRPQKAMQVFNPYKVLVSEIMLQQTQVSRVLQKFEDFLIAFPNIETLAQAQLREVLTIWQGMGYNRRAKFLHQAAKEITQRFEGKIPQKVETLLELPGIGSYTAGAIAAFAYNEPVAFFDTNIRKVYIHFFFVDHAQVKDAQVKEIAQKALYKANPRDWHYALMDYGSLMLAQQKVLLQKVAGYRRQSAFIGSGRYFRAKMLRYLLAHPQGTLHEIKKELKKDLHYKPNINIEKLMDDLVQEKFILQKDSTYRIV